jgi:hypothetical protein
MIFFDVFLLIPKYFLKRGLSLREKKTIFGQYSFWME